MTVKKRRNILLTFALLAIAFALGANVYLHFFPPREPPNYNEVEKGFYMGGRVPEPPPGTRAVLNLCELEDVFQAEVHQWSPIKDAPPAPTIAWLREQVEFIDKQRRAGLTTYVHCFQGVSRAGLVVTAYEMHKHGWTRDEALDFVRSKRSIINPNPAFRELLLEWEKVVKKP